MIEITIKAPQGAGKTRLAEVLKSVLNLAGQTVLIHDTEDGPLKSVRIPYTAKSYDVVIKTRQGKL